MSKKQPNLLLTGLGYYQLSAQRKKTLRQVMWISIGIHAVALLVFGSLTILDAFRDEPAVFVAPTPMKAYEPRELEHKVKVQQKQRSSSRPQVRPRLVSAKESSLALPEIIIDPKIATTSFQPQFKTVTGVGVGVGLGTGHGLGGFGTGVSNFDFFGIRGRGTRIAILLDLSLSMAEEDQEKGVTQKGIEKFEMVRNRIQQVIDALNPGAMFNVIVFAQTAGGWKEELQVATTENKAAVKEWLAPFNSRPDPNYLGFTRGSSSSQHGLPATGGTTRFDVALEMAFKQGADTVLVICDGDVWVTRNHNPEELAAHRRAIERWEKDNRHDIRDRASANENARYEERRVFVAGRSAQDAVLRERGGQEARAATEGRWETRRVRVDGQPNPRVEPAPKLDPAIWTVADYHEHIRLLHEKFYKPEGRPKPVIHVIGYRSDRDDGRFLQQFVRVYNGQFRRVTSIR